MHIIKLFLCLNILAWMFTSCGGSSFSATTDAIIAFDNTKGTCTVIVYSAPERTEYNKIAIVPAGIISGNLDWYSGSAVFFFTYNITMKDIDGFSFNYIPELGNDQIYRQINANRKTTIRIPSLADTIFMPDDLLSDNSYLLIRNNSSYSVSLFRGIVAILPDNLSYHEINPEEWGQYTITNNFIVSSYELQYSTGFIKFPSKYILDQQVYDLINFERGTVYVFSYNSRGYFSLDDIKEIKLINTADSK